MTTSPRFHHIGADYAADIDGYQIRITRAEKGWLMQIRELAYASGVAHTIGQPVLASTTDDTKRVLVAIATEFAGIHDAKYLRNRLHRAECIVTDRLTADAMKGFEK